MLMIKAEEEMRKGPWTEQEDLQLVRYVRLFGDRRWDFIAKVSGLNRSGKSCRLRWMNYLHPDLKRSRMTPQEQRLILELQSLWGNRWSRIASKLPGRTDNEIKNYWRTHMRKLARDRKRSSSSSADEPSVADNYSLTPPQPGPESVAGGQESNCGYCSLAAELEESNVDDGMRSYSMDRIWSEIVDSSEVTGNPSDFSGPLVLTSSPMFWEGCAEPLWKMDDEEVDRTLNIQSDHLVCNYYSGQEFVDFRLT